MTTVEPRSLALEDVLDELETLDAACASNDRWFRMKVRQMLQRRRALRSRPSRVLPEVGRD